MKYENEIRGFSLMIKTAEELRMNATTSTEADSYTRLIQTLKNKREQAIKENHA